MTIFYFTSTGNSLAVAKKIGGKNAVLLSIPQIIDNKKLEYKDDIIGIIFPIYGWYMPKMCRKFLAKAKLKAKYIFAIGTYGKLDGACMRNTQIYAAKHGNLIHYAKSLLMVDNYLPGFDIKEEIALIPEKKTDINLKRIISDINSQKKLKASATIKNLIMASLIQTAEKLFFKDTQAQSYIVNNNCTKCGTCAKICPSGNIVVSNQVKFLDKCEWCLGCVHLCPKHAIHLKNEKSAERWRNPDVSIAEMIKANNRTKT